MSCIRAAADRLGLIEKPPQTDFELSEKLRADLEAVRDAEHLLVECISDLNSNINSLLSLPDAPVSVHEFGTPDSIDTIAEPELEDRQTDDTSGEQESDGVSSDPGYEPPAGFKF